MHSDDYLFRGGSILTTRERLSRLADGTGEAVLYAKSSHDGRTGRFCIIAAGLAVSLTTIYALAATVIERPARHEMADLAPASVAAKPAAPATMPARAHPPAVGPCSVPMPSSAAIRILAAPRPAPLATPVLAPAYQPAATPDYAARDQRIQSLKAEIDALDEQIRRIRVNPKDNRYWYHYYGRYNGIDQPRLDAYLDALDKQRNDLRRQKWQLEGR